MIINALLVFAGGLLPAAEPVSNRANHRPAVKMPALSLLPGSVAR